LSISVSLADFNHDSICILQDTSVKSYTISHPAMQALTGATIRHKSSASRFKEKTPANPATALGIFSLSPPSSLCSRA
jgi:hypothetical protein